MMRVTFEKVKLRTSKRTRCEWCGKWLRRSTTLWQTLNPFNMDAVGSPKTRAIIVRELHEQAAKWKAEPLTCQDCEHGAQP